MSPSQTDSNVVNLDVVCPVPEAYCLLLPPTHITHRLTLHLPSLQAGTPQTIVI